MKKDFENFTQSIAWLDSKKIFQRCENKKCAETELIWSKKLAVRLHAQWHTQQQEYKEKNQALEQSVKDYQDKMNEIEKKCSAAQLVVTQLQKEVKTF